MFLVNQVSGLVKNFNIGIRHHKCNKCEILHDGTTHQALPVHDTVSDHNIILRSQQCQTILVEFFSSYPVKLNLCMIF